MIYTPADLERARLFARHNLLCAVNYDMREPIERAGRDELNPVYKKITENRDGPTPKQRASYSSCADLAHWHLRCVGIDPDVDWINRDDDADGVPWRSQVNLNWLCPRPIGKCPIAKRKLQAAPETGDVFVEDNAHGGHVFCAVDYDAATDSLITAEYGQPGGKPKIRRGFTAAFARRPLSHIRLVDVLPLCTAHVDFSLLVSEQWVIGELLDAMGYQQ